ncbi:MAG: hypothetical protein AAB416_02340 [Patescibacteria group bacterium]
MTKRLSWESTKVYDWKNYVIPARPSRSELKRYEERIVKLKKQKSHVTVAILGSTVEFRSLCHKYSLDVTVIEFSKKHYAILSRQQMKYRGTEHVREEDWRRMHTKERYDLILGDLVLNVVQKEDISTILQKLKESLSQDGVCMLRTWVRASSAHRSVDTILKSYRKAGSKSHFYTANIMPLYMCCYDFLNDNANYPAMIHLLKEKLLEKKISKAEYHACYDRWQHEGSAFIIPLKAFAEEVMSRFFEITNIRYGTDCFKKWAPIYILKRKNK